MSALTSASASTSASESEAASTAASLQLCAVLMQARALLVSGHDKEAYKLTHALHQVHCHTSAAQFIDTNSEHMQRTAARTKISCTCVWNLCGVCGFIA